METLTSAVRRDAHASKTRRGLQVTREKHQGISFVNATATKAAKIPRKSLQPSTRLRFVLEKRPTPQQTPKTLTEDDLRRAQEGENRRIAPRKKPTDQGRDTPQESCSAIPYQSVASTVPDKSFSFSLIKAWGQLNDKDATYLPSPSSITLPNWALHDLPVGVSDEGKMCFHAYLFSCPIRHYPFEQLQIVSWQPLSKDQSRFESLVLEPLMLNCTLTMGALFLLLNTGSRESAGFAMHSARLCALVNRLLGDKPTMSKTMVVIQSIASLAHLATFLGLYDHWSAHLTGLKHLVHAAGGLHALPAPVQALVKKADLKGASEVVTAPFFAQTPLLNPVSASLPRKQRIAITSSVRTAIRGYDEEDDACDAIASVAILVSTINFAASQRGALIFDPLALMEEYHDIEYRLLMTPAPIQTLSEALGRSSDTSVGCQRLGNLLPSPPYDMEAEARRSFDIALRLAALFFLKMTKGGSPDTLDGLIHMMQLLNEHMRRITYLPRPMAGDSVYGFSKSALIWIALVADQMARKSDSEAWNWGSKVVDRSVPRDLLLWTSGEGGKIGLISEEDIRLCHILDLRLEADGWDPLTRIGRILYSR